MLPSFWLNLYAGCACHASGGNPGPFPVLGELSYVSMSRRILKSKLISEEKQSPPQQTGDVHEFEGIIT